MILYCTKRSEPTSCSAEVGKMLTKQVSLSSLFKTHFASPVLSNAKQFLTFFFHCTRRMGSRHSILNKYVMNKNFHLLFENTSGFSVQNSKQRSNSKSAKQKFKTFLLKKTSYIKCLILMLSSISKTILTMKDKFDK